MRVSNLNRKIQKNGMKKCASIFFRDSPRERCFNMAGTDSKFKQQYNHLTQFKENCVFVF